MFTVYFFLERGCILTLKIDEVLITWSQEELFYVFDEVDVFTFTCFWGAANSTDETEEEGEFSGDN